MFDAKQTVKPAQSDRTDHQANHDDSIVVAIKRIADGIEALTSEIRRVVQNHTGSAAIDLNRTYSRAEVANLLKVSTRTVDRRVRAGAILAIKTGNTIRIDGASLHRHRTVKQLVAGCRVQKL